MTEEVPCATFLVELIEVVLRNKKVLEELRNKGIEEEEIEAALEEIKKANRKKVSEKTLKIVRAIYEAYEFIRVFFDFFN